jgi:hypothetical protein
MGLVGSHCDLNRVVADVRPEGGVRCATSAAGRRHVVWALPASGPIDFREIDGRQTLVAKANRSAN